MKLRNFILLPALLPVSVLASTVVYTDSQHLPENLSPDVVVVLLDEPERLQAKVFGQLPADPELAAMQAAGDVLPQWQQKQQQLVTAYRRSACPGTRYPQGARCRF